MISKKKEELSDNDTKMLLRHQEQQRRNFVINDIFWIGCKVQHLKRDGCRSVTATGPRRC